MSKYILHTTLIVLLSLVVINDPVKAQEISPERSIERARTLAEKDSLVMASRIIDKGLEQFPENYDLRMMLTRIYGWQGYFEKALKSIKKIDAVYPANPEITALKTDLFFWAGDYHKLLEGCNEFLDSYGNDPAILYKKALALHLTGQTGMSRQLLGTLLEEYPGHKQAENLKEQIRHRNTGNQVYIEYLRSFFNTGQDHWQTARAGYARKYSKGAVAIALSAGKMYEKNYQQMDGEWYHQLHSRLRMLVLGHYAFNPVTLKYGYGTELYYQLPAKFETGVGVRQFVYTDNEFWAVNGHLSKYFGSHFLALRPYMYILSDKKVNYAGSLGYRKYFDDEQWLGLSINYGYNSIEPTQSETVYRQNSGGFNGSYHFRITDGHFLRVRGGMQKEQLSEEDERLRYFASVGYWLTF